MRTYLENLITEKGKDTYDSITVLEENGHFGLTYDDLIEFICSQDKEIQDKIRDTLVKIDFNNGDVFDFIDYLAQGMLESIIF